MTPPRRVEPHNVQVWFRPLDRWTDPETADRKSASAFKASYDATLRMLREETAHLGADQVVIQVVIQETDLRQDGALRAKAKVQHPGVVVSIDTVEHGPLRFATDAYESRWYNDVDWHANLRAIALGLKSMRDQRRWGFGMRGEAYRGWRAIEGGIPLPAAAAHPMTREQAAEFIFEHADQDETDVDGILRYPAVRRGAIRYAQRNLHPDQGGDADLFKRLGEAARTLEESD